MKTEANLRTELSKLGARDAERARLYCEQLERDRTVGRQLRAELDELLGINPVDVERTEPWL